MKPPIYALQLQRNRMLVRQSINYVRPASAVRAMQLLIKQCGADGMVVVLQDGQEITPRQLRDTANAQPRARHAPRHDPR